MSDTRIVVDEAPTQPTLLQQRLIDAGVSPNDTTLYLDEHLDRLSQLSDNGNEGGEIDETKQDESRAADVTKDDEEAQLSRLTKDILEIKTLVWEVSCNNQEHTIDAGVDAADGSTTRTPTTKLDKFYIVTALLIEDKVELSLLRDLVYKHSTLPFGCTPSRLTLAPKEVAESLTGFRSGCIPPIGHSVPLPLYLDASIKTQPTTTTATTVSMGGGILGYSLLLPTHELLRVAKRSDKGCRIGSFRQQKPNGRGESFSSTVEADGAVDVDMEADTDMSAIEARKQRKVKRMHNRPEPKDRLKEYRKFHLLIDKAKLLRTTARKQGRVEDMKQLVEEAVATEEFPDLFGVSEDHGMDKNALHLGAWRGDFESVRLMVHTAKTLYPELDIVNMVSRGEGNYGKTPIFYALTQCREEIVRYLVAEGASLLIVNNKGQTPCSIAFSHLKEGACQFMFDVEARQLEEGGTFCNYRETNSDHKLYGDLDPRFPIDSDNQGETKDLVAQLEQYEQAKSLALEGAIHNGIPTEFSPRSVRPTVRWWVREARSLERANHGTGTDGQITFTQSRSAKPRKEKETKPPRPSSPPRNDFPEPIDIDSLDLLRIDEILSGDTAETLHLVSGLEKLRLLEEEIDDCLHYFSDPQQNQGKSKDDILVNSTWGIDCEWKPGVDCGIDSPVATLQLSTRRKVFLVDLQELCYDFRCPSTLECDRVEQELDRVLSKLFASPNASLLGYGVLQDLGKLAASFPRMKCFLFYSSVIDLQAVSCVAYSKSSRQRMSSLRKMVSILLAKRLDKTQQCSDWATRPLSQPQVSYAMLDAAVLPGLLKSILEQSSIVERYNGNFFNVHAALLSSVQYTPLKACAEGMVYEVAMGSIQSAWGQATARQCWPSLQDAPVLPRLVPFRRVEAPQVSKKERAHLKKVTSPNGSKRPKPVQLKTLSGKLDNLPLPGITLGYTKESCAFRVVGHELINTFPEGTYIGFNRRAGVVETTNAWIVFCNFGAASASMVHHGKSFSEFYDQGRHLTFRLNPNAQSGCSSEATLYEHITSSNPDVDKPILLFARAGTKSKYLYCGLCRWKETKPLEGGAISMLLELADYDKLVGQQRTSPDFEELVSIQQRLAVPVVG